MKARLLKKVRRRVHLYKRNKKFYVKTASAWFNYTAKFENKKDARSYYVGAIIGEAKEIFGFRPKSKIL